MRGCSDATLPNLIWVNRSPIEKQHTQMLALIVAAFLVHFVAYSAFFIEDAAITFSIQELLQRAQDL